jgi:hypothetical protein
MFEKHAAIINVDDTPYLRVEVQRGDDREPDAYLALIACTCKDLHADKLDVTYPSDYKFEGEVDYVGWEKKHGSCVAVQVGDVKATGWGNSNHEFPPYGGKSAWTTSPPYK